MPNPYARDVSHIKTLDPYRLQELYKMHPCAEHVVKKLLVAGEREGGKDLDHDISDCIRTLKRWQEMRKEDVQPDRIDMTCDATPVRPSLYDWSSISKHYQWTATDSDGSVFSYNMDPDYDRDKGEWGFWSQSGTGVQMRRQHGQAPAPIDPSESLERRP